MKKSDVVKLIGTWLEKAVTAETMETKEWHNGFLAGEAHAYKYVLQLLSEMEEEQLVTALVTAEEAAEILRITPAGIRQMVKREKLHPHKSAGRNLFPRQEVEAMQERPAPGRPKRIS